MVDPLLLGIGNHVELLDTFRSLFCNGGECLDADQSAASGIGQRLRRHQSDTKSRVASWSQAYDNRLQLARSPAPGFQQLGCQRDEVAAVPTGFRQTVLTAQGRSFAQGYQAPASRRLDG